MADDRFDLKIILLKKRIVRFFANAKSDNFFEKWCHLMFCHSSHVKR